MRGYTSTGCKRPGATSYTNGCSAQPSGRRDRGGVDPLAFAKRVAQVVVLDCQHAAVGVADHEGLLRAEEVA